MRKSQIYGHAKTIKRLVNISKQALEDGAYRVARRLQAIVLNMEGRPAPEIADTLKVHRSKVAIWLRHWQRQGMVLARADKALQFRWVRRRFPDV